MKLTFIKSTLILMCLSFYSCKKQYICTCKHSKIAFYESGQDLYSFEGIDTNFVVTSSKRKVESDCSKFNKDGVYEHVSDKMIIKEDFYNCKKLNY